MREDLPVGQNLQDHCMAQLNYETDEPSLFGAFTPENFALLETEGRGPLTSNIPEAGAFFRTRPGLDAPDIQFHFAPSMFYDEGLTAPHDQRLLLRPGRDQADEPRPGDAARAAGRTPSRACCATSSRPRRTAASMIAGMRIALEIAEQAPLKAGDAQAVQRARPATRTRSIMAFVRRAAQTVYHPTSTCAIGLGRRPGAARLRRRRACASSTRR